MPLNVVSRVSTHLYCRKLFFSSVEIPVETASLEYSGTHGATRGKIKGIQEDMHEGTTGNSIAQEEIRVRLRADKVL